MTDKQEKIIQAALELFAKEGFAATSTSKIAKRAGVSEGLIFRHYCNKDGLLQAILNEGEVRIKHIFSEIVFETDPKEIIQKTLNLGQSMMKTQADANFWKLQYKIKWELEQYNELKMEALEHALSGALTKLGFDSPEQEARMLLITLDGLATRYFLQKDFNLGEMIHFLHKRYLG